MGRLSVTVACIIIQITYAIGQLQPFCEDPADRGPCNKLELRYRFNEDSEYCETFLYGGCAGNKNNFKTVGECVKACVDEPKGSICEFPPDAGSCFHATLPRYYYDEESESCKIFYYSGCQGNENNFVSGEDCKTKCKALSFEPLPGGQNQGSNYQWNSPGSEPSSGNSWNSPVTTPNWNNPRPTNVVNRGWGNHYNSDHSSHNSPPPRKAHAPPAQYDFNSNPNNNNHRPPPPNHNNNNHRPLNNNNHHPNYNHNSNHRNSPNHHPNQNGGSSISFVENDPNNQKQKNAPPGIQPPELREYNGNSPWNSGGWNGNSGGWNSNPYHNENNGGGGGNEWRSNESRPPNSGHGNSNNNGWNNPGSDGGSSNGGSGGNGGGSNWNHSMSFKRRGGPNDQSGSGGNNGQPPWQPNNGQPRGPMSPMAHMARRFGHNPYGIPPRTTTPEDDIVTTPSTPVSTTPPYNYNYNHAPPPRNNHNHNYNWDSPPNPPPADNPPYNPIQQAQPFRSKNINNAPPRRNNIPPYNPPPAEPNYNYNKNPPIPPKRTSRRRFAPDWVRQQEAPSNNQQMAYPPTTTALPPPPPPGPANNLPLPGKTSWDNMFRRKKESAIEQVKSAPTEIASYDFEAGSSTKSSTVPARRNFDPSMEKPQQTHLQQTENSIAPLKHNINQYDFEASVTKHQDIPSNAGPPRKNNANTRPVTEQNESFPPPRNNANQYDFQASPNNAGGNVGQNGVIKKSSDDIRRENAMRMFNRQMQNGDPSSGSVQRQPAFEQTTNAPFKAPVSKSTYDDQYRSVSHEPVTSQIINHGGDDTSRNNFDDALRTKESKTAASNPGGIPGGFDSFLRPKGRHAPTSFQEQNEQPPTQGNDPLPPSARIGQQQIQAMEQTPSHGHAPHQNIDKPNNNFDRFFKSKEQNVNNANSNGAGGGFDNFLKPKASPVERNVNSPWDSKNNADPNRHLGSNEHASPNDPPINNNHHNSFDSFRRSNKWHKDPQTAEFNSIPNKKQMNHHNEALQSNSPAEKNNIPDNISTTQHKDIPQMPRKSHFGHRSHNQYTNREAFDLSGSHTAPTAVPTKPASVLSGADLYTGVSPTLGQGHAHSTGRPGFGISPASHAESMDTSALSSNTEPFSLTRTTPQHRVQQPDQTQNNDQRFSQQDNRQAWDPRGSSNNIQPTTQPVTPYNDRVNTEPISVTVKDTTKLKKIFGQTMPPTGNTKIPIGYILTHKPFIDSIGLDKNFPLLYKKFLEALKSGKLPAKDFQTSSDENGNNKQVSVDNQGTGNTDNKQQTEQGKMFHDRSPVSHQELSVHTSGVSTEHQVNNQNQPTPKQQTQKYQTPHQTPQQEVPRYHEQQTHRQQTHQQTHHQQTHQQQQTQQQTHHQQERDHKQLTHQPQQTQQQTHHQQETHHQQQTHQPQQTQQHTHHQQERDHQQQTHQPQQTQQHTHHQQETHHQQQTHQPQQTQQHTHHQQETHHQQQTQKQTHHQQQTHHHQQTHQQRQSQPNIHQQTPLKQDHQQQHSQQEFTQQQHWQAQSQPVQGQQNHWDQNKQQEQYQNNHHHQQQQHQDVRSQQQQQQHQDVNSQQQQQLAMAQRARERQQRLMTESRNQHAGHGGFNQQFNQLYRTTTAAPTEATTQPFFKNTYPPIFNMLVKNSLPPTQTPMPETSRRQKDTFQQQHEQSTNRYLPTNSHRQESNPSSYVPESSLRLGGPTFNPVHDNLPFGNHISGSILESVPEMQLYETREPVLPIDMISENKTKTEDINIRNSQNIIMDKNEKNSMKLSSLDPYYSKDMPSGTRVEKISTLTPSYVETTYSRAPAVQTTAAPITESVSNHHRRTPISHQHLPANQRHNQTSFESSFGRFGNSNQQFRNQFGNINQGNNNFQNLRQHDQKQEDTSASQFKIHKKTHITVSIKSTQPPTSPVLGIYKQKHSFETSAPLSHNGRSSHVQTPVKDIIPEHHSVRGQQRDMHAGSRSQPTQRQQQAAQAGFVISQVNNGQSANQNHPNKESHQPSNTKQQTRQTMDTVGTSAAFNHQHNRQVNQQRQQIQASQWSQQGARQNEGNSHHRQVAPKPPNMGAAPDAGFIIVSPKETASSSRAQQHNSVGVNKSIQKPETNNLRSPTPAPTQGYLNFLADFGGIENFAASHSRQSQSKPGGNTQQANTQNHNAASGTFSRQNTNHQQVAQNTPTNTVRNTGTQGSAAWGRRQFSNRFQSRPGFGAGFQQNQRNFQPRSTTTTTTTTTTTAAPPVRRHFTNHRRSQPQQGASGSSQNSCRESKNEGPCRSWSIRYFYDPALGNCRQFYYGGCGGNQNNFRSKSECLSTCYGS